MLLQCTIIVVSASNPIFVAAKYGYFNVKCYIFTEIELFLDSFAFVEGMEWNSLFHWKE